MKAVILTDGKAGHENQSKAFARALGLDFSLAPVRFKSPFHKVLSYLLDRLGVRTLALTRFVDGAKAPVPAPGDVVIGTGSGTFYAAKALARRHGVKCGVVLYPRGYHLGSFDCVLAPSFDNPKKRANVIEIPANLVAADATFYADGVTRFAAHYLETAGRELRDDASSSAVAVIVGGPNKCSSMSPEWMRAQLDRIFAETPGREHWVTTSRRTPPDVEKVVASYPWDYELLYSKDHFNPIPAFVSLASLLYVTAESTGMLSEACTSGHAAVIALDNLAPGPHKFRRFVENLVAGGYARGADGAPGNRKIDLSAAFAAAKARLA